MQTKRQHEQDNAMSSEHSVRTANSITIDQNPSISAASRHLNLNANRFAQPFGRSLTHTHFFQPFFSFSPALLVIRNPIHFKTQTIELNSEQANCTINIWYSKYGVLQIICIIERVQNLFYKLRTNFRRVDDSCAFLK